MFELRFCNLLLVGIFLFASCVAIERNNPDDPKSENYVPRSSSAVVRSSSSVAGASSSSLEEREHYGKMKPQFIDVRDGRKYVYVQMGTRTWMAENLNYNTNTSGSKCYNDLENYCTTYGRLYDWNTAKTACPSGWHLPRDNDWNALMKSVNPICKDDEHCALAGYKLKTASSWNDDEDGSSGNGTDSYGFSALPGGGYFSEGFLFFGEYGMWWSNSEKDAGNAYYRAMFNNNEFVGVLDGGKNNLLSVRCVRD